MGLVKWTDEERDQLELGLYLPIMLTLIEVDKKVLANSTLKIKEPYLLLLEQVSQLAHHQLYQIKKTMMKNRLKVVEMERDDLFTTYAFIVRGYETRHRYFNAHIRNKVQQMLNEYFLHATKAPAKKVERSAPMVDISNRSS